MQESGAFRTTQWSLVLAAVDSDSCEHRESTALEGLCKTYWLPLYMFARRKGFSVEDAEDHTQGFIASMISGAALQRVDRSKGRFRTYLLTCFSNYLANETKKHQTQKRGGDLVHVSWGELGQEELYQLEDPQRKSPEYMYDRSWALSVILEAKHRTREEYRRAKKLKRFDRFVCFLPGISGWIMPDAQLYRELASDLGMSEGGVRVEVHRLRKRYGLHLRQAVADTLNDPGETENELEYLIQLVAE